MAAGALWLRRPATPSDPAPVPVPSPRLRRSPVAKLVGPCPGRPRRPAGAGPCGRAAPACGAVTSRPAPHAAGRPRPAGDPARPARRRRLDRPAPSRAGLARSPRRLADRPARATGPASARGGLPRPCPPEEAAELERVAPAVAADGRRARKGRGGGPIGCPSPPSRASSAARTSSFRRVRPPPRPSPGGRLRSWAGRGGRGWSGIRSRWRGTIGAAARRRRGSTAAGGHQTSLVRPRRRCSTPQGRRCPLGRRARRRHARADGGRLSAERAAAAPEARRSRGPLGRGRSTRARIGLARRVLGRSAISWAILGRPLPSSGRAGPARSRLGLGPRRRPGRTATPPAARRARRVVPAGPLPSRRPGATTPVRGAAGHP